MKCTQGHDLCATMLPTKDCPYCEPSECDEIADAIIIPRHPITFSQALALVKAQMPDERHTIISNVAEAVMRRSYDENA